MWSATPDLGEERLGHYGTPVKSHSAEPIVPVVLIEPREAVQIKDRCRELLIEPAARVGRSRAGGGFREVLRRELATTEVAGQRTGRGATHEAHLRILGRAGDRAVHEIEPLLDERALA